MEKLRREGKLVQPVGPGPFGFADLLAVHPDAWGALLVITATPRRRQLAPTVAVLR
jgi:hypothetical protein